MHQSASPSVRACETTFPRYLQYPVMDFHQTFVIGASWDKDEVIDFGVKRSKVKVKFKVTLSRRRRSALDAAIEFNFLVQVTSGLAVSQNVIFESY